MQKIDRLKIRQSLKIIDLAGRKYQPRIGVFWSGGADSMVLLHLVKRAQDDKISLPVLYIDTKSESATTNQFIEKIKREWQFPLLRVSDKPTRRQYRKAKSKSEKRQLIQMMKIRSIKRAIKKYRLKALMTGIRWQEDEAYESEVYFSPRKNHVRIHPLLHFTKEEIMSYLEENAVPYLEENSLQMRYPQKQGLLQRLLKRKKSLPKVKAHKGKVSRKMRSLGYF